PRRSRAGQPRSRDGVDDRCGRSRAGQRAGRHRVRRIALELSPSGAQARRRALLFGSFAAGHVSAVVHGAGDRRGRVREPAAACPRDVRPRRPRHGARADAGRGGPVRLARPRGASMRRVGAGLAVAVLVGTAALALATRASLEPLPASLDVVAAIEPGRDDWNRRQVLDRNALPLTVTFATGWNVYDRVALHDVPRFLRDAFVAAEDRRFW